MNNQNLILLSEIAGINDGSVAGQYSPPLIPDAFPEEASAYASAYFHALAYLAPWRCMHGIVN